MKKKLVVLLALLLVTVALVAACSKGEKEHKHTFGDLIAEVPASCFSDGAKAHYHCSECNKDFAEDKTTEITDLVIPAHITESDWVKRVEPTCETAGNIGYYKCPVCGKLYDSNETEITEADTVIAATGHTLGDLNAATKATCLKEGRVAHYECSVCGKCFAEDKTTVLEDVKIPKLDHDFDEWVDEIPATCEKGGTKGHKTCKLCGSNFDADGNKITNGIEIKAKGHNTGSVIKEDAPECEKTGTAAHYQCDACKKLFVKDKDGNYVEVEAKDLVIAANGHSYGNEIPAVPATCEGTGTAAYYKCSACDKFFIEKDGQKQEVTADQLILAAKGHTYDPYDAVEPTATTPGNKAYYQCPDCKQYFTKDEQGAYQKAKEDEIFLPSLGGHVYVPHKEEPATCEADGTKEYYSCTHCTLIFDTQYNEITDPNDLIIPHTGHNLELQSSLRSFVYDESDKPTGVSAAIEGGKEDHYKCKNCDQLFDLNEQKIQSTDLKAENRIAIRDDKDMAALATLVSGGNAFAGESFVLLADVDLNTKIGYTGSGSDRKPFSGNFDGKGHTVTITQSFTNPDGDGGLFSFVRVPENSTVTIQNVHVTGTITLTNSSGGMGYTGGLISSVDAGKSGNGGTINITNVWNTVRINCGNAHAWNSIGGMIGFTRHEDGLKPLTVNMDSCVWDGIINCGPALYHGGGFVGYTGNNRAGRTLTINITNSTSAGTFMLNIDGWNQQFGTLISYAKGSNNDDATAKVTINISNVISTTKANFAKPTGSGSTIGLIEEINGTTELNLTNVYYIPFERTGMEGEFPVVAAGTANTVTNVVSKNLAGICALGAEDLTENWVFVEGAVPYPKNFVAVFGNPALLEINTVEEFLAFRDSVNAGTNYFGRVVKLKKDIDLDGEDWVSIGTPGNTSSSGCKSFCGTFDGEGHTISNMTTFLEPTSGYVDMQGGLFSSLGDGAVVKNFNLTGSYRIHNISTAAGSTDYFGSVANAVKGTVLIQNVHSSVNITTKVDKNSNDGWPGAIERVGGLVGFIYHNCSADLTIDGCEYSGTINVGNQAIDFAGIMAYTGNNNNSSTKVVTIKNCAFTGRMTVNENSAYAMQGIAGIISHVTGNATVTITGTHSDGKIYFNGNKDWPVVDGSGDAIKMGQILGYNEDGTTVNIDSTVTYVPAKLNKTAEDDESVYILPEAGYLNGVYAADTAAVMAVDPE